MLRRCAVAVVACALTACAAGARSGAPLDPAPAVIPAADPWPSPGVSLVYEGSYTKTTFHKSTSLAIEQRIQTESGKLGGERVVVYHGVETETGGKATTTTTFGAEVAQRPSTIRAGVDVTLLRATTRQAGIVTQTTDYEAGNGVFDQVPEVPQARWSNTAARSAFVDDVASDSTLSDAYHADGSYDENSVPVAGLTATAQSYADGNAVYQWPFEAGDVNSSIAFSPPEKNKLVVWLADGAQHVTTYITLASWYPSNPMVLASDDFLDAGRTAVPAACRVASRFGREANRIVETQTRLDIVFGQSETTTRTQYVAPRYGLVCLQLHDDLKTYYDYNTLALESRPLVDEITDEVLGLRSQSASDARVAGTTAALPLDAYAATLAARARLATARAMYGSLRLIGSHR
ncbi:MAG TPA: hypothetical protein VMH02_01935 [Verrucomicrobiae bacterium]|nr:hypothetical protein [Verrucomicrobiae bacterium]